MNTGDLALRGSSIGTRRPLARLTSRIRRTPALTVVCVGVLAVIGILVIFGPLIAPQDPNAVDLSASLQGPSGSHWFGTDVTGRDLFSRIVVGARTSVLGPLVIAFTATLFGTLLGLIAAWRRGWTDSTLSRMMDVLFAIPGLLLAMLAVAIIGTGITAPIIALSIANIPWVGRVVRSAALRERTLPYVAAYTMQGFSGVAICLKHVLPNIGPTVLAQGTLAFTYGMVDLMALNFLGLGVQPPTADWGVLVSEGQDSILRGSPEETLFASVFIVVVIVATIVLSQQIGGDEPAAAQPG